MEFTKEETERYKSLIIVALKSFDDFCNKHQLRYCSAYGTVLGAVRHGGFIHWDDEVDVYMPREDYEKLKSLENEIDKGFSLLTIEKTRNYSAIFSKYCYNSLTIWEKEQYDFVMGAYIDIFPLDYMDDREEAILVKSKYLKLMSKVSRSRQSFHFRFLWNYIKARKLKRAYWQIQSLILHKFFYHRTLEAFQTVTQRLSDLGNLSSKYLVSLCGPYKHKEIYNREWFSKMIILPFEDTQIYVPAMYDRYLHHLYGDYAQLPPVERRVSHHYRFYYSFDNYMSIDEVKGIVKNIDRKKLEIHRLENPFNYSKK